jgi:hypothetical protein
MVRKARRKNTNALAAPNRDPVKGNHCKVHWIVVHNTVLIIPAERSDLVKSWNIRNLLPQHHVHKNCTYWERATDPNGRFFWAFWNWWYSATQMSSESFDFFLRSHYQDRRDDLDRIRSTSNTTIRCQTCVSSFSICLTGSYFIHFLWSSMLGLGSHPDMKEGG